MEYSIKTNILHLIIALIQTPTLFCYSFKAVLNFLHMGKRSWMICTIKFWRLWKASYPIFSENSDKTKTFKNVIYTSI